MCPASSPRHESVHMRKHLKSLSPAATADACLWRCYLCIGKNWLTVSSCKYFMVMGRESSFWSCLRLSTFFAPKEALSLEQVSESLSFNAPFDRFSDRCFVNLSLVVYPATKFSVCVKRRKLSGAKKLKLSRKSTNPKI